MQPPVPQYQQADVLMMREWPQADVVLALSLAMYLFDAGEERGWAVLNRASQAAPVMFFDFGGMYSSRAPFAAEDAPAAMLARTAYTRADLLGRSALEREMVVFSR